LTPSQRDAAVQVHEDYWARLQTLQELTRGFWQTAALAELERLMSERTSRIEAVRNIP
jgi:hypothetical protein